MCGEGDHFGEPVKLQTFQKLFLCMLFEKRPDGRRRYRRALLEVPKGCGKTSLSAWIGAYQLATQFSAVIPVAAASYDQAELLFGDMRTTVRESPTLSQVMLPFEAEIQVKGGPGRAYKVAAIAGTTAGQRPSTFLADEIHEWVGGNKERVHFGDRQRLLQARRLADPQHHHPRVRPGPPRRADARLRAAGEQRRDHRRRVPVRPLGLPGRPL